MADSDEDVVFEDKNDNEFVVRESLDIARKDINLHVTIHTPFWKYVDGARFIRLTTIEGRSRGTEKLLRARAHKEHTKTMCSRAAG